MDLTERIRKKREEVSRAVAEAERLEAIQLLLDDSESRKIIEEQLGIVRKPNKGRPAKEIGGDGFSKLKDHMTQIGNKPTTIKELSDETALTIPAIRQIMSKTQAFKKVEVLPTKEGKYILKSQTNEQANKT